MRIIKNDVFICSLILALLLCFNFCYFFSSVSIGMISHDLRLTPFLNSDAFYISAFFKSLFVENHSYFSWYLTPAPYFFPDIFLAFGIMSVVSNWYIAMGIFAVIQQFLLFLGIYMLCREFLTKALYPALGVFLIIIFYSYNFIETFSFSSAYHFGEFLGGVWWLYLVIKAIKSTENKKFFIYCALAIILGSLLKFSDNLFTLHFIVPAVLAFVFLKILDILDTKKFFLLLSLCILSYLLGGSLYYLIITYSTQYQIAFATDSLLANKVHIQNILKENKIISFLLLIFFGLLGLVLLFKKLREKLFFNKEHFLFLGLFFFFMFSFSFLSAAHKFLYCNDRYFIATFGLGIIILSIFFFLHIRVSLKIPVVILAILAPNYSGLKSFDFSYKTPLSVCVDDFKATHKVKNGVSEYWQAKVIYMLSSIPMAQVDNNLADVRWITSDSFYKDKYDFVIINNKPIRFDFLLNKAKIISINGQPDEIIECKEANSEILYYKNGLYTDEFLATGKAMFTTKSLYTLIGKKIDDIIIIENASQKGIATYGPYIELKAGKYSFELVYSSLDSDESNTWDVASDSSKTILAKGELKDTNGEFKIASGEFELSSDAKIEVRTFYSGKGELRIKELVIKRDDR